MSRSQVQLRLRVAAQILSITFRSDLAILFFSSFCFGLHLCILHLLLLCFELDTLSVHPDGLDFLINGLDLLSDPVLQRNSVDTIGPNSTQVSPNPMMSQPRQAMTQEKH